MSQYVTLCVWVVFFNTVSSWVRSEPVDRFGADRLVWSRVGGGWSLSWLGVCSEPVDRFRADQWVRSRSVVSTLRIKQQLCFSVWRVEEATPPNDSFWKRVWRVRFHFANVILRYTEVKMFNFEKHSRSSAFANYSCRISTSCSFILMLKTICEQFTAHQYSVLLCCQKTWRYSKFLVIALLAAWRKQWVSASSLGIRAHCTVCWEKVVLQLATWWALSC